MKAVPKDVKVVIRVADQWTDFEDDGYFGEIEPGTVIACLIEVPCGRYHVFSSDGQGNIHLRKDRSGDYAWPDGTELYELRVPTNADDRTGQARTVRENRLKVLHLTQQGDYDVWDVGVCAQARKFFLIGVHTDSGICCWDGEKVVFPDRNMPWPAFEQFVWKRISADSLPLAEHHASVHAPVRQLKAGQGEVQWFNPLVGIGCVCLADGTTARVHWTQLIVDSRLKSVCQGDVVQYDRASRPEQHNLRTTQFTQELKGVRVIS